MMNLVEHQWLRARTLFALLVLSPVLAGCVRFLQAPPRIESIDRLEAVDWQGWRAGQGETNAPSRWAIQVIFRADRSLPEFHDEYGRTVQNEVWPCQSPADPPGGAVASDPYVFNAAGPVDSRSAQRDGRRDRQVSENYRLYIFVETRRRVYSGAPRQYPADHDLRTNRSNLCLRLLGGAMTGGAYASDTVMIPYADIRAALDRARM